jgi:hypothetical protein
LPAKAGKLQPASSGTMFFLPLFFLLRRGNKQNQVCGEYTVPA